MYVVLLNVHLFEACLSLSLSLCLLTAVELNADLIGDNKDLNDGFTSSDAGALASLQTAVRDSSKFSLTSFVWHLLQYKLSLGTLQRPRSDTRLNIINYR